MNGWFQACNLFQRRCAHDNCGFQPGKGNQPAKNKKILPKKQAASYTVEDLFKLDDVMKMLEKHWFGVSICFTFGQFCQNLSVGKILAKKAV